MYVIWEFIVIRAGVWQTNIYCLLRFASAVEDYQEAREFDDSHEIREGLERAQKLLKISRKRDYYKILGVGR